MSWAQGGEATLTTKDKKVQLLQGCSRDELLKVMDYNSLERLHLMTPWAIPHQELYDYMKQQALGLEYVTFLKQGSFHVDVPRPSGTSQDDKVQTKLSEAAYRHTSRHWQEISIEQKNRWQHRNAAHL
ncbi:uncharacterized protein LOC121975857 [Zingiber officinale]|uniref:uncharacterized protein LOC121975857 n=1 Tax=Zingiber officinale TaxID=94328 RepID=UPI001C4D417B|nr:uncharacterized protein LOC121975857 [Zingiber officinale]